MKIKYKDKSRMMAIRLKRCTGSFIRKARDYDDDVNFLLSFITRLLEEGEEKLRYCESCQESKEITELKALLRDTAETVERLSKNSEILETKFKDWYDEFRTTQ